MADSFRCSRCHLLVSPNDPRLIERSKRGEYGPPPGFIPYHQITEEPSHSSLGSPGRSPPPIYREVPAYSPPPTYKKVEETRINKLIDSLYSASSEEEINNVKNDFLALHFSEEHKENFNRVFNDRMKVIEFSEASKILNSIDPNTGKEEARNILNSLLDSYSSLEDTYRLFELSYRFGDLMWEVLISRGDVNMINTILSSMASQQHLSLDDLLRNYGNGTRLLITALKENKKLVKYFWNLDARILSYEIPMKDVLSLIVDSGDMDYETYKDLIQSISYVMKEEDKIYFLENYKPRTEKQENINILDPIIRNIENKEKCLQIMKSLADKGVIIFTSCGGKLSLEEQLEFVNQQYSPKEKIRAYIEVIEFDENYSFKKLFDFFYQKQMYSLIEYLFLSSKKGIDYSQKVEKTNYTPYYRKGDYHYLDEIFSHLNEEEKHKMLFTAIVDNDLPSVKYLIEKGTPMYLNIDEDNRHEYQKNALHLAAYEGNFEIVEYLISRGANIHAHNDRIIISALASNNERRFDIARLLVEKGINVNVSERDNNDIYTPLSLTAYDGNYEFFQYLIEKGADPHLEPENLMKRAKIGKNEKIISYLNSIGIH